MKGSLICVAEHVECWWRGVLGKLPVGALGRCRVARMELAINTGISTGLVSAMLSLGWALLLACAISKGWSCSVVELTSPFTALITPHTWTLWWRMWRRAVWGSQWDPPAVDVYSAGPPLVDSLQLPAHRILHWIRGFEVWRWTATASLACWKLCLERFGILPFSAVGWGALTSLTSFCRSTHYWHVEANTW